MKIHPRFVVLASSAAAVLMLPIAPSPAQAQSPAADPTAFCTQLTTSQQAISSVPKVAKDRFLQISIEWAKIARFAPAELKSDADAITAAYKTANGQSAADQKTTLSGIVKAAQKVTAFATTSCGGPGGPGGDGGPGEGDRAAMFAKLQACMTKKGATLPAFGGRDGRNGAGKGQPGQGGRQEPVLDAKTQAAFDACRTEIGFGGPGGFGGRGGFRNNPKLVECLAKKGVTLPTRGQGPGQAQGKGQAKGTQPGQPGQSRPGFDPKTQAAIQACRTELGLPAAPGDGGRGGAPSQPPVKAGAKPGAKPVSKA